MASFDVIAASGQFDDWARDLGADLAKAATSAVADVGQLALQAVRADAAAGGLTRKWQSAFRLSVFPQGDVSLEAAAVVRSAIPYAAIFETGGHIAGNPLLFLPLEANLPVRSGGRRWSPRAFAQSFGELHSVANRAGNPLLVGRGRDGRTVPVFVGVPAVTVPKRLHFYAAVARAAAQLDGLFQQRLAAS